MKFYSPKPDERRQLELLSVVNADARLRKRAEVLVQLDSGVSIEEVAQRYHVSRRTIYNWINRFNESDLPVIQRLRDKPRSGRPQKELTSAELQKVLRYFMRRPGLFETIKMPRDDRGDITDTEPESPASPTDPKSP